MSDASRPTFRSCSTKPSPHWRCDPDGVYVDGTFGRGGHSRAILAALGPAGRLVALDRDPGGGGGSARAIDDPRFAFRRAWFSELPDVLAALGIAARRRRAARPRHLLAADRRPGARLLVSRRRSARHADGSRRAANRAAEFLARADARELTEVIRDYGEERFAQSIARAIVAARAVAPVVRTRQLAAIVAQAVGARTRGDWSQDPATRTFQALRIFVNRELAELALTLPRIVRAARAPAAGSR